MSENVSVNKRMVYLAGPDVSAAEAGRLAPGAEEPLWLSRRGAALGWIAKTAGSEPLSIADMQAAWQAMGPILLPGFISDEIPRQLARMAQANALMEAVRDGAELEDLLSGEPYASRLSPRLELLSSVFHEDDRQEIATVEFDVMDGENLVAENIWVKVAWLSFEEEDASMRFRFSFGMENLEDVGADLPRELHAAALAEAVFPESDLISANPQLEILLKTLLGVDTLAYVERIVYFNAPDGGAQFHQDVERGHLGVVFAQLTGRTGWLALSKDALMDEITAFMAESERRAMVERCMSRDAFERLLWEIGDRARLSAFLDDPQNDPLEVLINRVPAFAQQLIDHGHGYVVEAGDVLLLPQQDLDRCAWHTVFCLGDMAGEALSFAIRTMGPST